MISQQQFSIKNSSKYYCNTHTKRLKMALKNLARRKRKENEAEQTHSHELRARTMMLQTLIKLLTAMTLETPKKASTLIELGARGEDVQSTYTSSWGSNCFGEVKSINCYHIQHMYAKSDLHNLTNSFRLHNWTNLKGSPPAQNPLVWLQNHRQLQRQSSLLSLWGHLQYQIHPPLRQYK